MIRLMISGNTVQRIIDELTRITNSMIILVF